MLRDRDIFIIQYTLDFISNITPEGFPADTANMWPVSLTEAKALLDTIDVALESSAFNDSALSRKPNSSSRDDFIINEVRNYTVKKYGARWAVKESDLPAINSLIKLEFASHQPISIKYPTGEPLIDEKILTLVEETKVSAADDTNYDKTRIYQRTA